MTPGSGHRGPGFDLISLGEAAYILEKCGKILYQVEGILALGSPLASQISRAHR